MKKILHIIVGLNVGGAELMLKRLVLQGRQDSNFSHAVLSLTDLGVVGESLQSAGITVYTLDMQSFAHLPKAMWQLTKVIRLIQPDIVQTWMYHADFMGGIVAKALGVKKIIWGIRTTDAQQGNSKAVVLLQRLCAKLSYDIPTLIVCAAHVSKDSHVKVGYDEKKMRVIPNGYELSLLTSSQQDRAALRQEIGLSDDDVVIGSMGRFNEAKNPLLFVKLAAELVKIYPSLKFMMVGRDNTWDNVELTQWLSRYHLTDNFRLLGQRTDVAACLKAMDVFCLHSRTEGFPNVLAEALTVGVPAVSFDVGDAKYILGELGDVIPQGDLAAMVRSISHIIDTILSDTETLAHWSAKATARMSQHYDIQNVYNQYRSIWVG